MKAKDFWFFSYACNGMNIKDICLLKFKDIKNDSFDFHRSKTRLTKSNKSTITVYLNEFTKGIINKYGNPNKEPNNYIFDILSTKQSHKEQRSKIQSFNRFINQHIKKICLANQLPAETSVMWARHSFATKIVRSGGSLEFVQESLGHSNIKTTQNYFNGFADDTKKEISESIMEF